MESSIHAFFEVEKRVSRTEHYYARLRRELGADVSTMLDAAVSFSSYTKKRQPPAVFVGNGGHGGGRRVRLMFAEDTDPDTEAHTSAG